MPRRLRKLVVSGAVGGPGGLKLYRLKLAGAPGSCAGLRVPRLILGVAWKGAKLHTPVR